MGSQKMKAWIFYEPEVMKFEEVDIPQIGDDEVLIKVKECGICGSDVAYYWGDSPLETPDGKGPLILGHEFSGEVVEVGKIPAQKKLLEAGDRVTVNPVQYCNACEVCYRGQVNLCENKAVLGVSANGAFAEYVAANYQHVYKLSDNVSYSAGAFVEPLANAVYGVKNLNVGLGNKVIVFGPGPIGLSIAALAKKSGAGEVILAGTRDYRLEVGKNMGIDRIYNLKEEQSPYYISDFKKEISQLTGGRMADRVIVVTGSKEAMQMALEVSGRRSIIVYFGLPGEKDLLEVPALQTTFWDKTIRFSWLASFTWVEAIQAVDSGLVDVNKLITHHFPLENLMEGLIVAKEKRGNPLRVMIDVG